MDFSILLLGASLHWGDPDRYDYIDRYEGFNPGLGIALHDGPMVCSVGAYHNSIANTSAFASIGVEKQIRYGLGVTGSVMLVTGYVPHQEEIPIVIPVFGGFYEHGMTRLHAVFLYDGVGFFLEQKF